MTEAWITLIGTIVAAVIASAGTYIAFSRQINKERKTESSQLNQLKVEVEQNLWIHLNEEIERLQKELEEERVKRRDLEQRVDALEGEKQSLKIENIFLSDQNTKLQRQVNEYKILVEKLRETKDKDG